MKLKIIVIFALFTATFPPAEVFCQQIPVLNQSLHNGFLLNPALAGSHSWTQAFLHVRDQWSSMPGAPFSYALSVDGRLKNEHSAVGFLLQGDRQPAISNLSGMLTYRYMAKLAGQHTLSMALSAGMLHNSIDMNRIDAASPTENTLSEKSLSKAGFNVNAGLAYRFKTFELGFAALQLTNTSYDYMNAATGDGLKYHLVRCFNAHASWRYDAGTRWSITPAAILYSTQGMPAYVLGACKTTFLDDYWLAAGYRTDKSLAFSCGALISERIDVGYSFELPVGSYRTHLGNTHEITLGIRIFGRSGEPENRRNVTQKDLAQVTDLLKIQAQQIDELNQKADRQKEQTEAQQQRYDSQRAEVEALIAKAASQKEEREEQAIRPEQLDSVASDAQPDADGRYIVVTGAYNSLEDAKLFQKVLEREQGLITWIYATRGSMKRYLVYSRIVRTKDEALKEYDRLYEMKIEQYKQGALWIHRMD
jgi:type IX secretion system PorP/SprF family membrane protein